MAEDLDHPFRVRGGFARGEKYTSKSNSTFLVYIDRQSSLLRWPSNKEGWYTWIDGWMALLGC